MPDVRVGEGSVILIHLSSASSILEQHAVWGPSKVRIAIDKLAYPDRSKLTCVALERTRGIVFV